VKNEGISWILQLGKLLEVQRFRLTDKTGDAKREILLVRFWQSSFLLQGLVQTLSDGAVGAISTHKDVTLVDRVVACGGLDPLVILCDRQYSFSEKDLVGWDKRQQEVIEHWPGHNIV